MPSNNHYVRVRDAMPCPACKGPTAVKETRGGDSCIRRRRFCASCGIAFTTMETFHAYDARSTARKDRELTPEESMQAEAKTFAALIPAAPSAKGG